MVKNIRTKALVLATLILTTAVTVTASAEDESKKVRVTTDGQSVYYQTNETNVKDFFKSNNIEVTDTYKVSADDSTEITDGMQITIVSPKKITVNVNNGAKSFVCETQCDTIGQLMNELKEKTGQEYKVADGHSSSEKLKDGSEITLREVKYEIYTETEELPYNTVEEKTDELYVGETQVKQHGVTGTKLITMKTIFYDDEQIDNYCIDRTVTQEPIDEIILVGTKEKVEQTSSTVSDFGDISNAKVVTMNATAYCPCSACNGSWTGQPSTMGLKVQRGIVAVDPNFIPLGTKLYVEGYGYCIAADTGGAIKGNRIDLCYNSHSEALSSGWGHTNVNVYILG